MRDVTDRPDQAIVVVVDDHDAPIIRDSVSADVAARPHAVG
ncbi:hypothetical protein [Umezawaea sp. Da 62-37]|nr:hypothetical protein [Umezawaea sp. Da 62-37]WNV84848.1 hypothetical protein RM788_42915 [Umezawaea sp. Da 62-37]